MDDFQWDGDEHKKFAIRGKLRLPLKVLDRVTNITIVDLEPGTHIYGMYHVSNSRLALVTEHEVPTISFTVDGVDRFFDPCVPGWPEFYTSLTLMLRRAEPVFASQRAMEKV